MTEKPLTIFNNFELAKIHWKSQALAHFIIGIPMGTLTVLFWGVSVQGVIGVATYYFFLYLLIYFPLYGILPEFSLKPVKSILNRLNNHQQDKISQAEYIQLIRFLIALPGKTIPSIIIIEISAFVMGSLFWKAGYVPELLPILDVASLETFVLGIVVSLSAGLLNFALIESKAGETIQYILQYQPDLLDTDLQITKISLNRKIFTLIIVTTIIAVFSILLFFTSYLIITTPEKVVVNLIFISIVLTSSLTFLVILAPIISGNLTRPLKMLIKWSEKVSKGDLKARIKYVTNDEIVDLINDSNKMVSHLERTEKQIDDNVEQLLKDRDIITTERNKLSTVLTEIEEGIIMIDSNYNTILVNKMAQSMLGYEEQFLLNRNINEIMGLTDASEDKIYPQIELESLYKGSKEAFTNGNYKLINSHKYVTIKARYFTSMFDQKVYFILTIRDVTKMMSLEEMRLDFVSMAAHELRTPLTSIRGYIDMFLEENKQNLSTDGLSDLMRAASSAERLSELVDNLLDVSKIERGNFPITMEVTNWQKLICSSMEQLKINGKSKNISINFIEPTYKEVTVVVDKLRIIEVLSNLISNAITYTPEGGKVTVWTEVANEEVIVHVEDTGQGIADEAQKHLFTKFYRAKRSLEQGSHGTGLGLFMSKSIIEMHKGKIWFTSTVGKGSVFSFSLPIKR